MVYFLLTPYFIGFLGLFLVCCNCMFCFRGYTIDKYFDTKFLNCIKLLTNDIKTVRLFVMLFVISTIIIYNYFTIFRKDARAKILNQYKGKFTTLIKYHNFIFALLLLLPFILIYLLDN